MNKIIFSLLLFAQMACAGFPPTTSKDSSDANNVTTFNYQFPNFTGTHTGITFSLGVNSVVGGGTGAATFTAHGVLVGEGTSPVVATAVGTAGQVLVSNGPGSDPTFQTFSASGPITTSGTSEIINRATISGGGSIVSQSGSWLSSVSKGATGFFTLNIAGGVYSATPSLSFMGDDSNFNGICMTYAPTITSTTIPLYETNCTTGIGVDNNFTIIVMGPH